METDSISLDPVQQNMKRRRRRWMELDD